MAFNYRILVVDDEEGIRRTSAAILETQGYEVRTAGDGFEALLELRRALPEVIISDLRMPNMSGFELLSIVRRRFPQIPVIAISGEFSSTTPEGLLADHFFNKGEYNIQELFRRIAELLAAGPMRPAMSRPTQAPVWVPRNTSGYFVVTCLECLRSFSVPDGPSDKEVREADCTFCSTRVCFLAEPRSRLKLPKRSPK